MDRKRRIYPLPWIALLAILAIFAGTFFFLHHKLYSAATILGSGGALLLFPTIAYAFYQHLKARNQKPLLSPLIQFLRLKIVITFGLAALFLSLFIAISYLLSQLFSPTVFIQYLSYYLQFPAFLFQLAAATVGIAALLICLFRMLIKHIYIKSL